jgi:hypothetical protein
MLAERQVSLLLAKEELMVEDGEISSSLPMEEWC